ncbi:MAG TPA: ATP-binding protein [Mycobacteriales bacterium]|nr:ATP-binding protein [Mycobacteriales bacterium]
MDAVAVAALAGGAGLIAGAVGAGPLRRLTRIRGTRTRGPRADAGTSARVPAALRGASQASGSPQALGALLDLLPFAALVTGGDGAVLRGNAAARALGAHRAGRLVFPQLRQLVDEARAAGALREADLELPRGPFGTDLFVVHARAAPLPGAGTLLVLDDRTEARRVEAVRRDFVANVSHELKTPVVGLTLLAEAIADAADDPEAVRRFAGRMQRESDRLGRLVRDLLELSRLQGAEPRPEPAPVPLDRVVTEAVDRCRVAAGARAITLVTGGDTGLTVHGDERQLATAVGNLVENAVAYSPDGTRVAVTTRSAGDIVEVSVTDEGIGIPAADLERIFERFYRVDPARSRATGGTGLGLAIAKHVANNHGGEVRVWSVEGSGSTFTLRLPLPPPAGDARPSTGTDAADRVPEEALP